MKPDVTSESEERSRQRCRRTSAAVQALAVGLLCAEAALLVSGVTSRSAAIAGIAHVTAGLVWALAIALFFTNVALVRFGPQDRRVALAPMLVNRAGFGIRLAFHMIINWSAIGVTLLWAAGLGEPRAAARIATVCAIVVPVVWLAFNIMHRRFNRARNLVLSSAPAICLLLAAAVLIRQGPGA